MKIRLLIIALLSLLAMAPDVPDEPRWLYFPLVYKPHPVPTLYDLYSLPHLNSGGSWYHNIALIFYNRTAHAVSINVFDDTTNELIGPMGYLQIGEGVFKGNTVVDIRFPVPCEALNTNYHVRFDVIFEDGWAHSVYGTFIPLHNPFYDNCET